MESSGSGVYPLGWGLPSKLAPTRGLPPKWAPPHVSGQRSKPSNTFNNEFDLLLAGVVETASAQVFVLGVNGCNDLTAASVRRRVSPDRPAAALGYIHHWLEERDLGDDLHDAFLQMNENGNQAAELVTLMRTSDWSFELFPARYWRGRAEAAVAILEVATYGFAAAIVFSEIIVVPFGFVL